MYKVKNEEVFYFLDRRSGWKKEPVWTKPEGYWSLIRVLAKVIDFGREGADRPYYDVDFTGNDLHAQVVWAEIIADIILFSDVMIRGDLSFYFLFNIIIYSLITRNLYCGGTKMRAKVNPTEKLRERYDNNNQIVSATATLLGAGFAIICPLDLQILFIFALIGNIVDNFFYLYIYNQIKKEEQNENTNCN